MLIFVKLMLLRQYSGEGNFKRSTIKTEKREKNIACSSFLSVA